MNQESENHELWLTLHNDTKASIAAMESRVMNQLQQNHKEMTLRLNGQEKRIGAVEKVADRANFVAKAASWLVVIFSGIATIVYRVKGH